MREVMMIDFENGDMKDGSAWCKEAKIPTTKNGGMHYADFAEVEKALIKLLPRGFPVMDPETGLAYSEGCVGEPPRRALPEGRPPRQNRQCACPDGFRGELCQDDSQDAGWLKQDRHFGWVHSTQFGHNWQVNASP